MPTELPIGWKPEQSLGGDHFGKVYALDSIRVSRLIPSDKLDDQVRKQLLNRAEQLGRLHLPYVATPIAWGSHPDGMVHCVERRLAKNLSVVIPKQAGLSAEDATQWFLNLLDGLAALHTNKLEHGDVRPENVFLDACTNGKDCAWLADATIGHLWWWTKGRLISPGAADYHPPEFTKAPGPPSPRADLYALGVVACEMYLGKKAVDKARKAAPDGGIAWKTIKPALKTVNVPGGARVLLGRLLKTDPDKRPQDACAARKSYGWREKLVKGVLPVAVAAVLVVVVLGGAAIGYRERANTLGGQVAQFVPELNDTKSKLTGSEKALRDANVSLKKADTSLKQEKMLREKAEEARERAEHKSAEQETTRSRARAVLAPLSEAKDTPVAVTQGIREALRELGGKVDNGPERLAEDLWKENSPPQKKALDAEAWRPLDDAIRGAGDEAARTLLEQWRNSIRMVKSDADEWFPYDTLLTNCFAKAAEAPWIRDRISDVQGRIEHLKGAREFWRTNAPPTAEATCVEQWQEFEERIQEQEDTRSLLDSWFSNIRGLRQLEHRAWFAADRQLAGLYDQAVRAPWDRARIEEVQTRFGHLRDAAELFYQWATDTELTFAMLGDLIDDPSRPPQVNNLLKAWHRQFLRPREWTLQLNRATAPDDRWGTRRQVSVQGSNWVNGIDHHWKVPTGAEYQGLEYARIPFSWKPDEPTGVILYGERSWGAARYTLIDARDEFQGPLSVWLMHVVGRVRGTEARLFVLTFEIVDCPGPPRAVIQGLLGRGKQHILGR